MNCRSCVSRLFLCALALGETLFLEGCSADRNGSPWDSLPQADSKKIGTPDDDDDNNPAAPNPKNGPQGPEDGADASSSAPPNSGDGGLPTPPVGDPSLEDRMAEKMGERMEERTRAPPPTPSR
jgi:hypothetical protein